MRIKSVLGAIFIVIILFLMGIYYFMPFSEVEFISSPMNDSFVLNGNVSSIQFYSNMRFANPNISYKIENCNIKKKEEIIDSFNILENLTILDFYSVSENENITITCDEKTHLNGNIFIAGEGGPTEIVKSGKYNVILHGNILLIKSFDCPQPNVALHELFHVLGFVHSDNPQNIMYNYTSCRQTIGEEIPNLINNVYSEESYADLIFGGVSAMMSGRYIDINMTIKNFGLKNSDSARVFINMGGKILKEIELEGLEIGGGTSIQISNLFVGKIKIEDFEMVIDYSERELDKENNRILLQIK